MSGIAKGLKKVFKKVGKFVKKILPIALIAGAAIFTGGFGLLAAPGAAAAGGAAGGGGLGGWVSSLFKGGAAAGGAATAGSAAAVGGGLGSRVLGGLGKFLTSETGGAIISGAASGFGTYLEGKQQEKMTIDAEERRSGSYEGAGAAASFRRFGLEPEPSEPPYMAPSPARPSVASTARTPTAPRWQFDKETNRVVYT